MLSTAMGAAASVMVATIDPSAWTQSSSIAWPGSSHAVMVMKPSELWRASSCEQGRHQALQPKQPQYSFKLGEFCEQLVVLMNLDGGVKGGEIARWFLAHHESFHLAAQMYGSKVPIRFLEIDQGLVSDHAQGEYFSDLYSEIDLITDRILGGHPADCASLERSLSSLSDRSREYLEYKIFWEWPAEFYAQQIMFPGRFAEYKDFRQNIFVTGDSGSELFLAGVKTGLALDVLAEREAWQREVSEGWSMFDLLLSHCGCDGRDPGPTVRMRRVDLGT